MFYGLFCGEKKNKMKTRNIQGVLRLKEALLAAATAADFEEIARQLLVKAREGNASAVKLFLEIMGTPSAPAAPAAPAVGDEISFPDLPDLDLPDVEDFVLPGRRPR